MIIDTNTLDIKFGYLLSALGGAAAAMTSMILNRGSDALHLLPIYKFFVHMVVGSFVFGIVAVGAVGIHFFIHAIGSYSIPDVITSGLVLAEYALFIADFMLFMIFIGQSSITLWRELTRS